MSKIILKNIMPVLAIMCVLSLTTSCTSDDEPEAGDLTYEYHLRCLETSGNPESELDDMICLDAAYGKAFGIVDGVFTLNMELTSASAEISRKAEKVEASFIGRGWSGSYKIEIIEKGSSKAIYSHTFLSEAENLRHPDTQPTYTSYTFSLTQVSGDGSEADKTIIKNKFTSAFGISNGRFTIYGDNATCSSVITTKTDQIHNELNGQSWGGKYKAVIKEYIYESTVYSHTFE